MWSHQRFIKAELLSTQHSRPGYCSDGYASPVCLCFFTVLPCDPHNPLLLRPSSLLKGWGTHSPDPTSSKEITPHAALPKGANIESADWSSRRRLTQRGASARIMLIQIMLQRVPATSNPHHHMIPENLEQTKHPWTRGSPETAAPWFFSSEVYTLFHMHTTAHAYIVACTRIYDVYYNNSRWHRIQWFSCSAVEREPRTFGSKHSFYHLN